MPTDTWGQRKPRKNENKGTEKRMRKLKKKTGMTLTLLKVTPWSGPL